jgi:hypothetical protein
MGRVLASLAAALLAACTVETEGAACRVTGRTEDCPSGQACGTDLTCSLRAASCQPCTAGARTCSGDDRVVECTAAGDGACGVQVLADPCAALERCDASAATAACVCARIEVVPRAGAPTELPGCTFLSVAEAFSEAGALGLDGVHLAGAAPASYVDDPAGVTVPAGARLLADDDPPRPADRVLVTAGVALAAGSTARGFAVHPPGAGSGAGVTVDCVAAAGSASVDAVEVARGAGGEAFETGVQVRGACPVDLAAATVRGAKGAGLLVERDDPVAVVTATDLHLAENGVGVRLVKGDLTLTRPLVEASGGDAIVVAGESTDAAALLVNGEGTGVLRGAGELGSAGVRLACSGTRGVSLAGLAIEPGGAGGFADGVVANGACPVTLGGVGVRGASGAGLLVERSDPAATLAATGLVLEGNGTGAVLRKGVVTLQDPSVAASAGDAIQIDGREVDAVAVVVDGSGGTGSLVGSGVVGSAGVRIGCLGATAGVALRSLRIDADPVLGGFDAGLVAAGACPVELAAPRVVGARRVGLEVARDAGGAPVTATDAVLSGNGAGVQLRRGALEATRLSVDGPGNGVEVVPAADEAATLTLRGGTVRGGGGKGTSGVRVACGSRGSVLLDAVTVTSDQGAPEGAAFDTGVHLGGACDTTVEALTVTGATGAGLHVARDAGSSLVPVTNARLEANGTGSRLEQGDVDLRAPIVASNEANGIEAQGQSVGLSIADGLIRRNGRAGLWVATPLRFELVRTRLCGNAGARETLSGNPVWAGGMLVIGNPPAGAVVAGNRFDENGGDQVVFYNGGTWNLSAPSCDATLPNAFAGYDLSGGAVGLFALGARVHAVFAAWPSAPVLDTDYRVVGGSAQVNVGAGTEQCLLDVAPACP